MFGKKKKAEDSKTLQMRNSKDSLMKALSITPEMMTEAVMSSKQVPAELKQAILDGLPEFIERIDEATQKIYDPSQVWFESLQFADYVGQLAQHLTEDHGPECREEISTQLRLMSESWKDLAENAMEVLDKSEEVFKHGA
jgi:hypothetical protein